MPLEFIPVESSQFDAVAYDPLTQKLTIKFKRNAVYEYDGVLPETHKALMEAPSKGAFFIGNIKKGGYTYRRLPAEGETQQT